jgi:ActR/RegA family two-component response regulator
VLFVVPRSQRGTTAAPHPLWDEITARFGIDEDPAAQSLITRDVSTLLRGNGEGLAPVATLPVLALPEARGVWNLPPETLSGDEAKGASATALQTLASCPLAWVLEHRANLRFGAVAKVADGPLLNGNLSHRLVEDLFNAGTFDLDEVPFLERVDASLERLIQTEGATLLLEGAAFERTQLSTQIRRAMRELHRYLRKAGFRIAAVEEPIAMHSVVGSPHGRLDVRLTDESGKDAVLDLKWGASTYRALLETGRAIQLAVYTLALGAQSAGKPPPPAAYYAISSAKVLTSDPRMKAPKTIEGISLEETWKRVTKTKTAVRESLARGQVPVANTRRALPLLKQLGVPEAAWEDYYQAEPAAPCEYCAFDSLCGRAWEGLQ